MTAIKDQETSISGLQTLADREINNDNFRELLDTSSELKDTLDKTWDEVQSISQTVNEN